MTSKHGHGGGQNQQPKNCVKASHKLNLTTFAASVMFRSSIFLVRSALSAGKLLRSSQAPGTTTTRWPMSRPGSCLGTQSDPDEFTRGSTPSGKKIDEFDLEYTESWQYSRIHQWYPWCQTCVCVRYTSFLLKVSSFKQINTESHTHMLKTSRIGVYFPTARPRFHHDVRRSGRVTILNWPDLSTWWIMTIFSLAECLHDLVEERARKGSPCF